MSTSDQLSGKKGAAKTKDPLHTIIGLVALAYSITYVTVGKVERLLGSELGASILLTVFYSWIGRSYWKKLHGKPVKPVDGEERSIDTGYRRLFWIVTAVYITGLIIVWTKDDLLYALFPKADLGIIVNNIDNDNSSLLITRGIKDNITHQWTSSPESDSLSLTGDAEDPEKIKKAFKRKRFLYGLCCFGSFRPVDSVLSGEIYLFHIRLENSNKSLINFPQLDSIHVTVTKKVALFGNLIASLALQAQKNWSQSNAVLAGIMKDSCLLSNDFKYYCYAFRANNYSNLNKADSATKEASQANSLRPALQDFYFDKIGHTYVAHSTGGGVDTIRIKDDLHTAHQYVDSLFFYKRLIVVGMESDSDMMHCYIKLRGGSWNKVITWPRSSVTHLLDSINRKLQASSQN